MGQPTPPGDSPLFEGLDASWNDIVGAFPEDRRSELAPKLKERISSYEDLKPWGEFSKNGVSPDQASTALNLYNIIETNPREVYDTIGKHLGITAKQAEEVVDELEDADSDDPRIAALQQQVETLAQIALAQRQQTSAEQQAAEQDAKLNKEIEDIQKKYGKDIPEDEILMRMLHKNMTAEQAYQEYSGRVSDIQKRRAAPFVMGGGGTVPNRAIDPVKLDSKDTKSLVAQMMQHANSERNA